MCRLGLYCSKLLLHIRVTWVDVHICVHTDCASSDRAVLHDLFQEPCPPSSREWVKSNFIFRWQFYTSQDFFIMGKIWYSVYFIQYIFLYDVMKTVDIATDLTMERLIYHYKRLSCVNSDIIVWKENFACGCYTLLHSFWARFCFIIHSLSQQ